MHHAEARNLPQHQILSRPGHYSEQIQAKLLEFDHADQVKSNASPFPRPHLERAFFHGSAMPRADRIALYPSWYARQKRLIHLDWTDSLNGDSISVERKCHQPPVPHLPAVHLDRDLSLQQMPAGQTYHSNIL